MAMVMFRRAVLVLGLGLATVMPAAVLADQRAMVYAPGGVALSGYDAVSYFSQGHPEQGNPENAIMWRGATWYFVSPESEMSFEMNPEAYAPQFGGYCAYSVSEGQTASGAPEAFFLYQGRLYLMHDLDMVDQMKQQIPNIVAEAQSKWPAVLGR